MPAVEESDDALVAEARAAIDRSGPGYGDPPLFQQGGHREAFYGTGRQPPGPGKGEEYETHYTAKFRKTPPRKLTR